MTRDTFEVHVHDDATHREVAALIAEPLAEGRRIEGVVEVVLHPGANPTEREVSMALIQAAWQGYGRPEDLGFVEQHCRVLVHTLGLAAVGIADSVEWLRRATGRPVEQVMRALLLVVAQAADNPSRRALWPVRVFAPLMNPGLAAGCWVSVEQGWPPEGTGYCLLRIEENLWTPGLPVRTPRIALGSPQAGRTWWAQGSGMMDGQDRSLARVTHFAVIHGEYSL